MRDQSAQVSGRPSIEGRLRIAYVIERVVTLAMVLALCLRAHRIPGNGSGALAALLAVGALVIVRMAGPLWLWVLLGRGESARAARRSQLDALESAALAFCGLALAIGTPIGILATLIVAGVWAVGRRIGHDLVDEAPFASLGTPPPAPAAAIAERMGFPPENIIVDEHTHAAARTISYRHRSFILLAPHVPDTYNDREMAVIVAHELAHVKRHDVVRIRIYHVVLCLAAIAVIAGTVRLYAAGRGGASVTADPVAMVTGVVALALMEMLCMPVQGWLSRRIERRANRWALEATGDTEAFISTMTKLHSGLGNPPEPAWWSQLIAHGHPSLGEVLAEARRAAPTTSTGPDDAVDPAVTPSRDTVTAGR